MSGDTQRILLDYLSKRYANLKSRLTQMLGSSDLAGDALHDTWLRLKGQDNQEPVLSPGAYLVRMAVNIAVDSQRRQRRMLSGDDIDALLEELADSAPGPAQTAEVRSDLEALAEIMDRMPARRREILILLHWEDMTQKEAAQTLGISLRTVASEIRRAHASLDAYIAAEKN